MKILKLISFVSVMLLSLPVSATVYNVMGGTFTLSGLMLNINSTGGTLNINEGATAYQGFGEILDPFMYSGSNVKTHTSSLVAGIPGGNAPSGNVVDGGNVDMSSFFVNWNSNDIASGSSTASVTAISGGYQLAWQSDPFGGKVNPSFWTIDIAAVPLPSAGWLMVSGVVGLLGLARQRKNSSSR